ncbi:MAG TPA: FlgD immunoglobulin-like domain containing protein [Candidatus Eisenbacteria bacterium]|nr:FlgD immunoglobulin-like domain containing protein [Candidatus Eisenbacteria bacterium]
MDLAGAAPAHLPSDLAARVFDVQGRLVASIRPERAEAGQGFAHFDWNGRDGRGQAVATGVYFIRVEAPSAGYRENRKIVLR